MATITLRSSGFPLTNDQIDANFVAINTEVGNIISSLLPQKANLDSPALSGTPTAPTPISTDNSTRIATTAYVNSKFGNAMTALAPLTPAANQIVYYTSSTTAAMTNLTAFGRSLIDDADAATARSTLGLGTVATGTSTTSTVDNTAGRFMRIGDAGLTNMSLILPTNVDLNTVVWPGAYHMYAGGTPSNVPPGMSNFIMFVFGIGAVSGGRVVQVVHGMTIANEPVAFRISLGNDTWTEWRFYRHSGNTLDIGTTAAAARTALGLGTIATLNSINNTNWSGTALSLANGGTGSTTAAAARTALGLGTIATLNSINNTNWSGTALDIANGGTGATTAAAARTNLSAQETLVSGTNIKTINGITLLGSGDLGVGSYTIGNSVSALNQSAISFTGIPSTASRITLKVSRCTGNGANIIYLRLGTSSGFNTSGYQSSTASVGASTYYASTFTTGILLANGEVYNSIITIERFDSSNKWIVNATSVNAPSESFALGTGDITLANTLDRVQILRSAGTFNGGTISIAWE